MQNGDLATALDAGDSFFDKVTLTPKGEAAQDITNGGEFDVSQLTGESFKLDYAWSTEALKKKNWRRLVTK
ncbi:hypothetical protein [Secundilactobacillus kimchicus]|uniref:hypothetical protein n=1 Tax=Secundilactobacillus kimchicus TaxID=528209 RepID=UPI002437055F|nr:hypothetical protein [Secundilactobacillus kimchicus]